MYDRMLPNILLCVAMLPAYKGGMCWYDSMSRRAITCAPKRYYCSTRYLVVYCLSLNTKRHNIVFTLFFVKSL